jgi:hypothetical protein
MGRHGPKAILALHFCFAILVLGLVAIDLVAAEAFFTQGRMSPLTAPPEQAPLEAALDVRLPGPGNRRP